MGDISDGADELSFHACDACRNNASECSTHITDAEEVFAFSGDEADSEDEAAELKGDGGAEATPTGALVTRTLTASQKILVRKAHINLGHPEIGAFCRLFRQARARLEVIEYVRKWLVCDVCDARGRAGARRPAAASRTYVASWP